MSSFVSFEAEHASKASNGAYSLDDKTDIQLCSSLLRKLKESVSGHDCGWVKVKDVQRMLAATEDNTNLTVTKLREAVLWKARTLDGWLAKYTESEMRFIAVGFGKRPVLYHCAAHQRPGDVLAQHWASCFHKSIAYMEKSHDAGEVPYTQMDIIVDCHGFQPLLNLTVTPWLRLGSSMDSYFAERIHRCYVIDFPSAASWIWSAVKRVVPQKTARKVCFVSRSNPASMQELFGEVCVDEAMKMMLEDLLKLNKASSPKTGREPSHLLTETFLRQQLEAIEHKTSSS